MLGPRRHLRSLNGASSYRYVHHDNGIAFHSYQHRSFATAAYPLSCLPLPSLLPWRWDVRMRRLVPSRQAHRRVANQDATRTRARCERTFTRPIVMLASPGAHSFCNCWKTAPRGNLSRERERASSLFAITPIPPAVGAFFYFIIRFLGLGDATDVYAGYDRRRTVLAAIRFENTPVTQVLW